MSQLSDELATMNIEYVAKHMGLVTWDGHKCDRWDVTFTYNGKSYTTEYNAGLGNRKKVLGVKENRGGYYRNGIFKNQEEAIVAGWLIVHSPKIEDALYCLLNDASSADEMFEDWCSNFGYDNDSRKALDIYLQCQKTRSALVRMFGQACFENLSRLEH